MLKSSRTHCDQIDHKTPFGDVKCGEPVAAVFVWPGMAVPRRICEKHLQMAGLIARLQGFELEFKRLQPRKR